MSPDVINLLTEAGPLGIFALYLIWQRQKDTARNEALQERFLARLDAMDARSDAAISDLRDRYDRVISTYNNERVTLITGFDKLDQIIMRLGMSTVTTAIPPAPAGPKPPTPSGVSLQIEAKVAEALEKFAQAKEDEPKE